MINATKRIPAEIQACMQLIETVCPKTYSLPAATSVCVLFSMGASNSFPLHPFASLHIPLQPFYLHTMQFQSHSRLCASCNL